MVKLNQDMTHARRTDDALYRAFDDALAYAKERKQFGQPIADFQAIQWMIADTYTELEAARLLLMNAASASSSPLMRAST